MIMIPVKSQPDGSNFREIILKISWHTQLKYSKPYTFILQKVKNLPDGLCTHLFFASSIILIFGDIFLHRLSRIIKVKIKWIRLPTTDFVRQKFITRRDNPNSSKPSLRARKKPPKGHTKNRLFLLQKSK